MATHRRHRLFSVLLGGVLLAGCLAPNGASLGSRKEKSLSVRSGVAVNVLAGGHATPMPERVSGRSSLSPTSVQSSVAPVRIISNNGANAIHGTVRVSAGVVSHNGANIVSNNGGGVIGNNGGGLISNNGAGLKLSPMTLAYATVRLVDAAGNPVRDASGTELQTTTDAQGNYAFPVDVDSRNLIVAVDVPGQAAPLVAFLPKEGRDPAEPIDVDMSSTLTVGYILERYVKGDLATFERLPKDAEAKARATLEEGLLQGKVALPETLDRSALVATVEAVRKQATSADEAFETVKKLLVIAGIVNEGDGLPATQVDLTQVAGLLADEAGNLYIFSQVRHTLWKKTPDGILHTLVAKGEWGYPEETVSVGIYTSGMLWDQRGNLLLADTFHDRIVKLTPERQVQVVAGNGGSGEVTDGMLASQAPISRPAGLALDAQGRLVFSDSAHHCVRRIESDSTLSRVAGNGSAGYSGDGGLAVNAQLNGPQGLALTKDGSIWVADFQNKKVRKVDLAGEIVSTNDEGAHLQFPLAFAAGLGNTLQLITLGENARFEVSLAGLRRLPLVEYSNAETSLGRLSTPHSISSDGTRIYIEDGQGCVFSFSRSGELRQEAGILSSGQLANSLFADAIGLQVDGAENVYVLDDRKKQVFVVRADGRQELFAGKGGAGTWAESPDARFVSLGNPSQLGQDQNGNLLVLCSGPQAALLCIDASRRLSVLIDGASDASLRTLLNHMVSPRQLKDGRYVFCDLVEERLAVYRPGEGFSTLEGTGAFLMPYGLQVDAQGTLVWLDRVSAELLSWRDGVSAARFANPFTLDLSAPRGLAVDSTGRIYAAGAAEIQRASRDGRCEQVAGARGAYLSGMTQDDSLGEIRALAFSPGGNLYILEPQQLKRLTREQLQRLDSH